MKTVADELARRYGLRFDSSNFDLLERGLARQAATLGVSVEELCRKLTGWESLPALWQQTIEHVTVNETYLFRHPEQFQVLSKMLVPQRLFGGQRKLRAWSAGCSTGEEAYSLAMVLSQAAPHVEVAAFSWFNPDEVTGDFASEIRLGYVVEGEQRRPFKGGQLIGNVMDALAFARWSRETGAYGSYMGPRVVRLEEMVVAL